MPVETGNDFFVLRGPGGAWMLGVGYGTGNLPTTEVPEGALYWDRVESKWYAFQRGSWSAIDATMGDVIAETLSLTSTLEVTGAATLSSTLGVTGLATLSGGALLAGDLVPQSQVLADDGAITIKSGIVVVTKSGAAALTIADPTATTDDYKSITVVSTTAAAHVLTGDTDPGFNGEGAGGELITLGGAKGDGFTLTAYQGTWYLTGNINATVSAGA